ncbi:MAG TPA: PspC domain-containing protein [Puia sp.]|nr:PspC domain-containing protein [Puia sp.]
MKKIININFHSRVVPIEESAYEILQQYIESLRRHFANEEGRDEIISDIENRFAELFSETLKKGAACITDADVNAIIASMGRPEDFEDEEPATATNAGTGAGQQSSYSQQQSYTANEPRRLYRAENDKILGGVASGLANYLNIDPAIVRIIFVLMCFGGGAGLLLYIILWVVLPTKSLPANARKRLYRNSDDRVIGGVASGLAAYFHIEVWIPRLIFIAPLILSVIASIFRHAWFDFDGPVFFTGGFGGTLFITYIVLWIVMPEAVTASEKLEMRGEKVDLESIKNTIKSDLGNFSRRAKDMGTDMKSTFQKTGEQVKQSTQNFASEAYPAARRAGTGIGHAIGVLFKAFFLFIAGCIAFGLIMALFGLVFRGHNVLTIKNFILTGFWQNFLAWASFILFLIIPIVALLTWLIRRVTGVRSRHHYLTYVFITLWVIGIFCTLGLAAMIVNNFRSRQHVEENLTLTNPSHGKLIVKTMDGNHDYYDGDWIFDFNWNSRRPFYNINDDSFAMNTVLINLIKSEDSSYHVKLVKFSLGENTRAARQSAEQIDFPVRQSDSILTLPYGFTIARGQKFRNQKVLVLVAIPVGKHIMLHHSVDEYRWFSIDVRTSHIRWNRRDRWDNNAEYGWDDDIDVDNGRWETDVDYVMTENGLSRTNKRSVDYDDEKDKKKDKHKKDLEDEDENPGYRYKRPAAPAQPKTDGDTVKKTAVLQAVTDSHLYLLSALFQ